MEALDMWNFKSSVDVGTTSGSVTIHLRTLGGLQDEQRTDAALAASVIARTELENKNSALHTNHIAPLLSLDKNGLKEVVTSLQRGLFIREARWQVEPHGDPDAPEEALSGTKIVSKPSLDNVLDWKDERDSLRGELEKRRKEWVDEQADILEKELKKLKVKELRDRAVDLHKGAIVERAYNREWDWQTVLLGSFRDENCTKSQFSTIQEVRDLPRPTFLQIADRYLELDIFSRNPERLKNSS